MTTEQAIKKLGRAIEKGMAVVVEQAITEVNPFVPIFTSDLRDSVEIDFRGTEVELNWGKLPYARRQHEDELRHLGTRGNYQSLKKVNTDYGPAYRKARSLKILRKSRAKWFTVLNDRNVILKLARILVRKVRQELG